MNTIQMFGYAYEFAEVHECRVHCDKDKIVSLQQEIEYLHGIPCHTYSYIGDDFDIERFV